MREKATGVLLIICLCTSVVVAGADTVFKPAPYFPKDESREHIDLVVAGVFNQASAAPKKSPISESGLKDVSLATVKGALEKATPLGGASAGSEEEWQSYAEVVINAGRACETSISYSRLIAGLRDLRKDIYYPVVCEGVAEKLASGRTKYDGKIVIQVPSFEEGPAEHVARKVESILRTNHQGNLWRTYNVRHLNLDVKATPGKPVVIRDQAEDMLFDLGPYVVGKPPGLGTSTAGKDEDPFFAECHKILSDVIGGAEFREPEKETSQIILAHLGILTRRYENSPQVSLLLRAVCEQAELERWAGRNEQFTSLLDRFADLAVKKCPPEQAAMVLYKVAEYYRGIMEVDTADRLFVRASEAAPDSLPGYAARLGSVLCILETGNEEAAITRFSKVFEEKWKGEILIPCYEPIAETCFLWMDTAAKEGLSAFRALAAEPSYKKGDWAQMRVIMMAKLLHEDEVAKVEAKKLLEKYPESPYATWPWLGVTPRK